MGAKSDLAFLHACEKAGVNPVVAIGHEEYPKFGCNEEGEQKPESASHQENLADKNAEK